MTIDNTNRDATTCDHITVTMLGIIKYLLSRHQLGKPYTFSTSNTVGALWIIHIICASRLYSITSFTALRDRPERTNYSRHQITFIATWLLSMAHCRLHVPETRHHSLRLYQKCDEASCVFRLICSCNSTSARGFCTLANGMYNHAIWTGRSDSNTRSPSISTMQARLPSDL